MLTIAENGAQYFWDSVYTVIVTSNFYLAVIGVGCVMGLIALVWWGTTYLFPKHKTR